MWKLKNVSFYYLVLATDQQLFSILCFCTADFSYIFRKLLKIAVFRHCSVKWGYCTLYSVYGISANDNAVFFCHAVSVGNEKERGWIILLSFLSKYFPSLNKSDETIMKDRENVQNGALVSSNLRIGCNHFTALFIGPKT